MTSSGQGVAVRGLGVRFPTSRSPALHDVDLDLDPGAALLVMGSSGSGKSTLLRVLAGIVPQTVDADVTGAVGVAGIDPLITPVPLVAEKVATLTQNPLDQLCLPTVVDEVAFGCENRGMPREQIGVRVRAALGLVGAAHLLDRRTSELSGGEGQRVALAAALVTDPEVLLLDEPTSLLDPAGVRQVGRAISTGSRGTGARGMRTSLLIEHRLDEVPDLPGRVLVLGPDGSVHTQGRTWPVLLEQGVSLAATGANLPVRAELSAALGYVVRPGPQAAREALTALTTRSGLTAADDREPQGEVVLRTAGLGVHRGTRRVVRDVDLTVTRGRVVAVLGRNGSGKSSLLLGLAGLLPVSGALDGGSVGMVFQHPEHQFLTRTVREEIGYGLAVSRHSGDAVPGLVTGALDQFDLQGLADRDPFRLSGGQQRRLSLASMAVLDHDVLLADEPTFGQDGLTSRAVAGVLRRLADQGRGVVVATHDLRLVGSIADDVLVVHDGRVLAHGPTDRVLRDVGARHTAGLQLSPLLETWRGTNLGLRCTISVLEGALTDRIDEAGTMSSPTS